MRERVFVFPIIFGAFLRLLYTPCVLWCAPFGVLIQFALTIKKILGCVHGGSLNFNVVLTTNEAIDSSTKSLGGEVELLFVNWILKKSIFMSIAVSCFYFFEMMDS